MQKWMAVFGMALVVSGCSDNPSRRAVASNGSATPPASTSQPGYVPPREDLSRFVRPIYPGFDALFGVTGTTAVYVTIAPDGHVLNAQVDKSSGHRELDAAAIAAMRQSFFIPARKNGNAIVSIARVPVNFNANYSQRGMWPSGYLNPHYILDTRAFPYSSVESAFEGLSAQSFGSNNSDGHLTTFKLINNDGSAREEWAFTDMGSPQEMAIRFVFAGTSAAPEVWVSAICQEGASACAEKTSLLSLGPSFARGIQQ
jgi:TonB family protein